LEREELFRELRFLLPDGREWGGAAGVLAAAGEVWWARPFVWLGDLPGVRYLLDRGYRWVAQQRDCPASGGARGHQGSSLS